FLKQIKKRTKTIKEFLDIQVTETVDPENYIRISSSRPLYYNDKIDSLILVEDSTKLNIKDLLMKKDTFTYVVNYTLSDEKIYQIQLKDSTFFDNSLTYTKANKYPVVKRKIDT